MIHWHCYSVGQLKAVVSRFGPYQARMNPQLSALEDSLSQVWFDTTGPIIGVIITNCVKRSEIVCDDVERYIRTSYYYCVWKYTKSGKNPI